MLIQQTTFYVTLKYWTFLRLRS